MRQGRKNQLRTAEPWSSRKRFGSDLTKTIRARGRQGLHREAGHTTVPDPHAALRSTSCLPTRGASTYGAGGAPGFQPDVGLQFPGQTQVRRRRAGGGTLVGDGPETALERQACGYTSAKGGPGGCVRSQKQGPDYVRDSCSDHPISQGNGAPGPRRLRMSSVRNQDRL